MASSLYQNAVPGRPAPLLAGGTYYRQNQQHPTQPPVHFGPPNHYNYGFGPPPPYPVGGPPITAYNPSYVYGSAPSHGPQQNQFSSFHRPPSYPLASSHLPSAPVPSPPSHHNLSFSIPPNFVPHTHQTGPPHPPYYTQSLPPLPSHLPPPLPPLNLPSGQPSSHGIFSSSLSQQQLLPPPPPPSQDTISSHPASSYPNILSAQHPVAGGRLSSAQGNPDLSQSWSASREVSTVGAAWGNWGSTREGNTSGPTQGAWDLSSSQAAAPAARPAQPTLQGVSSSHEPMVGALPTEFAPPPKPSKAAGVLEASRPGSALRSDNKYESGQLRRERKKKEHERKKLEENKKDKEKQSSAMLQKNHPAATPKYVQAPNDGRRDRKSLSSTDKAENRLKRASTFLCKIRFRNELPDPLAQPKLLHANDGTDQYSKYTVTSLEKTYKHKLLVESDLGIPLDLLDIIVYNAPKVKPPLDPEDEELLHDDDVTPVKTDSIRKKERPTDKGVAWLVKTQYISPINLDPAKQSLTEKQAKELKEQREGRRDFLDALNDREQQIQSIEESFRVANQRPVHQTKLGLEPVEILPLLPAFDRWDDQLVHMVFDGEPTADSELHSKLDPSMREELEAKAIMKSFVFPGTDALRSEKYLAYMVPKMEELVREIYDEDEEIQYTWVREYHWDVRAEDAQNTITYLFSFEDDCVHYQPLGTKLTLQKKKAKEGRAKDEAESQYAVPSIITVCRREFTQEEQEEKERQRVTFMGGLTTTSRETGHLKHTQSPEAELPPSKRRAGNNRDLSDDDVADEISL